MVDEYRKQPPTAGSAGWQSSDQTILPGLLEQGMAEALLDLLEDGIIVHDETRKIVLVNQRVEEITGQAKADIVGRDCHQIFPPNGLCASACAFKTGTAIHNVPRSADAVFERPDGETRYIRVKSTPIFIGQSYRGVLAVVRDRSELEDLKWRLDKRREFHGMIGASRAIAEVFETIRAVGPSDYPVLISGESGTGKELAAGAIHKESRRKDGPFVPVNCGALPENILESELFGHVRGAFTGAIRDKKGRFELADGGTIFLDEVGELPLHMQAKLLRVLQERSFERVGGEKQIKVDIRVISASNRDLREMLAAGEFREDLFYRLCVVPLELPPLRQRKEDIPFIAAAILNKVHGETGKRISDIADDAMQMLMAHPWRGNVRELINALQFASVLSRGSTLLSEYLPHEIRFPSELSPVQLSPFPSTPSRFPAAGAAPVSPEEAMDGYGKKRRKKLTEEAVQEAIRQTNGNKLKAAKLLGVGRATLYRFFDDHPGLV